MDNKNIIEYYDHYVAQQQKSGINERIYKLYKKLLSLGLHSGSTVLELGSGIGAMTFLLSTKVKMGQVEAVDISPESIRFSRQRLDKKNITFFTGDIVHHKPSIQNIHFITLFDVLEHIPVERHHELFHNILNACGDDTKILINIPNPEYIKYDIKNNTGTLQLIDQPLELKDLLQNLENNGLALVSFETYSIWVKNDYQFLVASKKGDFKETRLSDQEGFFQKAFRKAQRWYVKIRYNYR